MKKDTEVFIFPKKLSVKTVFEKNHAMRLQITVQLRLFSGL